MMLDEAHERTIHTDVLFGLLKKVNILFHGIVFVELNKEDSGSILFVLKALVLTASIIHFAITTGVFIGC